MVLKRNEKVELSQEYAALLDKSVGLMVFEYRGLSVAQVTELRAKIRESKATMRVVKNRMLKRALEGRAYQELGSILQGPNAVIFATEDPIAPARVLMNFAKSSEWVKVKAGMIENMYLKAAQAEQLATLPSLEELHAKILGGIQAPARQILGLVKGLHQKLHGLLKAHADKLEEAA